MSVTGDVTVWDEYIDWPVSDWQYDVANGDTRLGYHDWVDHQREDEDVAGRG